MTGADKEEITGRMEADAANFSGFLSYNVIQSLNM